MIFQKIVNFAIWATITIVKNVKRAPRNIAAKSTAILKGTFNITKIALYAVAVFVVLKLVSHNTYKGDFYKKDDDANYYDD